MSHADVCRARSRHHLDAHVSKMNACRRGRDLPMKTKRRKQFAQGETNKTRRSEFPKFQERRDRRMLVLTSNATRVRVGSERQDAQVDVLANSGCNEDPDVTDVDCTDAKFNGGSSSSLGLMMPRTVKLSVAMGGISLGTSTDYIACRSSVKTMRSRCEARIWSCGIGLWIQC